MTQLAREESPAPIWRWSWGLIALTALLAHLPALGGYFFQDDWTRLAALVHGGGAGLWGPRPLSRVVGFELGLAFFGLRAAAWHATALCAWAAASVLTQKLGLRMGLRPFAALVAGLITAATPVVLLPVFWASASAEIFAVLFGLLALGAWLHPHRLGGMVAVLAGLASFFCKESLLALPLLLMLLPRTLLPSEGASRAWRRWALVVLLVGAATAGGLVWKIMAPATPHDPYAMGGPRLWLMNLLVLGAWLISPVSFALLATPSLPFFGALVWAAWVALAIRQARAGRRRESWWLLFALGSLAPVLPLARHLQPYYLLGTVPAFAWSVGGALDLLQERAPLRPRLQPLLAALLAFVALGVGYGASARRFEARDARGQLENPLALRSALAYEVAGLVGSLPLQPGETLAVLAATATEWPKEMPVRMAQRLNSKIYVAIDGAKGLSVMVPQGVSVRWDSHLDGLRADSMILFDNGGTHLRVWGRVRNARFYSALLAMAAQQYQRALHDLWVVGGKGTQLDFVYQPELLPVAGSAIDENASPFVHYILSHEDDTALARRLVLLFEQLYKAVRGKELHWASDPTGHSSPDPADSDGP